MPPGDPDDIETERLDAQVSRPVPLECGASAVSAISVEFDDEIALGPREVDDECSDPRIDLRLGKAVPAAEPEEACLQLAAGAVWLERIVDRQAEELGLAKCGSELRLAKSATEVGEGAARCRNGDSIAASYNRCIQNLGSMNPQPSAALSARG